jgi:predicted transcriptional regulator YdeE
VIRLLILAVLLSLANGGGGLSSDQQQASNSRQEGGITYTDLTGFTVIGIETRTNNAIESTADGVIPKQWQKFFSGEISEKILHKSGPSFYAVYSDYASDHNGEYSYLVGAKVEDGTTPPDGMVLKRIPAGKYAVFTSDKGPFAKVVPAAWQKIFQLEDEGKLKRSYHADFEVYDQRSQDPQNAQVDIYIGLK